MRRVLIAVAWWLGCHAAPPQRPPQAALLPLWFVGVWQRDWIRLPHQAPDASKIVRWLQTPSAFGDLRIPITRPRIAARSIDELTDEDIRVLALQSGFAGTTSISGMDATWKHEIDFQPSGGADVGRIERRDDTTIWEHDPNGSYVESWTKLDSGGDRFLVMRASAPRRMLLIAGDRFYYARDRALALPPADSLVDVMARADHATQRKYVDCELSFGTVRGWQIQRSTLPWREGARLEVVDQITEDGNRVLVRDPSWRIELETASVRALFAR